MKILRLSKHDKKSLYLAVSTYFYALCSSVKIRTYCVFLNKTRKSNAMNKKFFFLIILHLLAPSQIEVLNTIDIALLNNFVP